MQRNETELGGAGTERSLCQGFHAYLISRVNNPNPDRRGFLPVHFLLPFQRESSTRCWVASRPSFIVPFACDIVMSAAAKQKQIL